ncbi:MAG: hypothetical protein ACREVT_03765 [Burkholderiales bacterium]
MIMDFQGAGATVADRIDLADIDANPVTGGDDLFSFLGTGTFNGVAGELRVESGGGSTVIQGDVNGDAAADFEIELTGLHTLAATDFIL